MKKWEEIILIMLIAIALYANCLQREYECTYAVYHSGKLVETIVELQQTPCKVYDSKSWVHRNLVKKEYFKEHRL